MFSDHFPPVRSSHAGKLLLALGAFAIAGQLGAVAMVADGQVKKAELRQTRLVAERQAVAHCLESVAGESRHNCLQQARADFADDALPVVSRNSAADLQTMAVNAPVIMPAGQGLMPVSMVTQ
ncbi:MAG: hypothetical protein EON92_17135 [Burkholderiales bacterium]|nr:MAG: hypothetical protein EON92_17135 [Burkholderiales bacterium]